MIHFHQHSNLKTKSGSSASLKALRVSGSASYFSLATSDASLTQCVTGLVIAPTPLATMLHGLNVWKTNPSMTRQPPVAALAPPTANQGGGVTV